jgi:hypothetical protein
VTSPALWPPIECIRRAVFGEVLNALSPAARVLQSTPHLFTVPDGSFADTQIAPESNSSAEPVCDHSESLDICRRREEFRAVDMGEQVSAGCIVGFDLRNRIVPVLLLENLRDDRWLGLLVSSECDWASAHDVLLEPSDEPFDPVCGMVQTWNLVNVDLPSPINILGRLSEQRLAAIWAVRAETTRSSAVDTGAAGRIALRQVGEEHTVLTGTSLGEADVRLAYRDIYGALGQEIESAYRTQTLAINLLREVSAPGRR